MIVFVYGNDTKQTKMQEINIDDLIPGKEYYLECFTDIVNNKMGSKNPPYRMIATFQKMVVNEYDIQVTYFTHFRRLKYKNNKEFSYDVQLNQYWKFYEKSQEKIQRNMETRAFSRILREVTSDEYFTQLHI